MLLYPSLSLRTNLYNINEKINIHVEKSKKLIKGYKIFQNRNKMSIQMRKSVNNFEYWLSKNLLVNNLNFKININQVISQSFSSCKKIKKLGEKFHLSTNSFQINMKYSSKEFQIFDNGIGFVEKEVSTFFKQLTFPVKTKKKKEFIESKEKFQLIDFARIDNFKIITKKLGNEDLLFYEIDLRSTRIFLTKIKSPKSMSFFLLNISMSEYLTGKSMNYQFYRLLKKSHLLRPFWLSLDFFFFKNKIKYENLNLKKTFDKKIQESSLYSSLRFFSLSDYLNLFNNINAKWNYPLCMFHLTYFSEKKIDIILYVPRYYFLNSLSNKFSLFRRVKFDEILKDDINFLLEKITPDWILFGTGVIEFQKIFSLKMDRKSKITRSEIEIKKEISKSIIELLSNLSQNYPNCYRLFWATYSNSLKANLLQKRYMIKNFLHLFRFFSTKSKKSTISLQNYVLNMKKNQKEIYFFSIRRNIFSKKHPNLEILIQNDIEVLLLFDASDEILLKLIEKKQELWRKKKLFFKEIGSLSYFEKYKTGEKKYDAEKWEPEKCLKWFSDKFSKKFFKINNSRLLCSSPSSFLFLKNFPEINHNISPEFMKQTTKQNFVFFKKTFIIFEINGANNLIRILNKYLKANTTTKISKEIGLLLWEVTHLRCGILLDNEENFSRRVENLVTIFVIILYHKKYKKIDF